MHPASRPSQSRRGGCRRCIGAEIDGVDLRDELNDDAIAAIREALLRHKVIFFRDQDITAEQHIAFARRFGRLEIHPATPKDQEHPEVLRIAHGPNSRGTENNWHSDVTWREEPSLGSILRAIELPDRAATRCSPTWRPRTTGCRRRCRNGSAASPPVHDIARVFAKRLGKTRRGTARRSTRRSSTPWCAPTPRPAGAALRQHRLHVAHRGSVEEGERLVARAPVLAGGRPEYQCRFVLAAELDRLLGQPRQPALRGVSDYFPEVRVMERVTIAGDRPYFDPAAGATLAG